MMCVCTFHVLVMTDEFPNWALCHVCCLVEVRVCTEVSLVFPEG